jgi:hypothetical protein
VKIVRHGNKAEKSLTHAAVRLRVPSRGVRHCAGPKSWYRAVYP